VNEKWQEYFLEGDRTLHFIKMPKGIRLWYSKFGKYAHVDYDLYPTKYRINEEGEKAVWKLYYEVANKKAHIFMNPLTAHMKIPIEKLEYAITTLMKILPTKIEEDPELKKFEQWFGVKNE